VGSTGEFSGANLALYSVTFVNELQQDREALLWYKAFREEASRALGKAAPKFISACLQRGKGGIPKSQTKIYWARAKDL